MSCPGVLVASARPTAQAQWTPRRPAAANGQAFSLLRNSFFGEQVVFQFAGKFWVFTPNPLQQHGSVFFLLVSIVYKDRLEFHVLANISALVVPICGFQ